MTLDALKYAVAAGFFALSVAAPNGPHVRAADKPAADPRPLEGTKALTLEGDIASTMVAGIDRFLLRQLDESAARRGRHWKRDFSSHQAYARSIAPQRKRLAHILGVRDERVKFEAPRLVASVDSSALIGRGGGYEVRAVQWPAFGDVTGEGLLLTPMGREAACSIVAIPDADQTPEQLVGLVAGLPGQSQFARRLAESGCRVIVPVLIDRTLAARRNAEGAGGANLTTREFLYRPAYELGRHIVGYEVQKVLAAVDWFVSLQPKQPVGVMGWGEGGGVALCAAALDERIDAACVSGYFDTRQKMWQEPADRNVFAMLDQFGDAELASMVAPRPLVVEASRGPQVVLTGEGGGAPGRIVSPRLVDVRTEVERVRELLGPLGRDYVQLVASGDGQGSPGTSDCLKKFLALLTSSAVLPAEVSKPHVIGRLPNARSRQDRQAHEIDRHNQQLLEESPDVRAKFMARLDTTSLDRYQQSTAWYRRFFYDEVIGRFDQALLPPGARSRKSYDTATWTGYEVVLDVLPDVMAYGILLMPKGIRPGERRPVVVCQHGLEGRPQHVFGQEGYRYYKAFAAKLAERGYITFAPQNLYIFEDRFRTLQRKANPLGKTLYSIIVPQHQQITDWLKTLPQVDPQRIAFYGLSYGGKTAMRVPPLVDNYCLSICSGDFNDWVWKNASSRSSYSYAFHGEYEIFEFDLGSTFNYSEMAALIAPRPFMVERGHFDPVAPDERVALEFAKVRHLYQARLGIGQRCAIEWFVGPHTINGQGTFDFLARYLKWPPRAEPAAAR